MYRTNFNNTLDSLLGFILIFLGLVVLGYVLIHLLWWIFLIAVGIGLIVMGVRLRNSYREEY